MLTFTTAPFIAISWYVSELLPVVSLGLICGKVEGDGFDLLRLDGLRFKRFEGALVVFLA